jgi:hypothetical protein
MIDRYQRPVRVGDLIRFRALGSRWAEGVVREIVRWPTPNDPEHARVDDGDPAEPELRASGFTVCALVDHNEIEVLAPCAAPTTAPASCGPAADGSATPRPPRGPT